MISLSEKNDSFLYGTFYVQGIIAGQETLRLKFNVSIPYPDCGEDSNQGTCEGISSDITHII